MIESRILNRTPQFHVGLAAIAIVASVTLPGQAETVAIPELNPKGDVYKTEGPNDPLIYGSTIGRKTAIMLYVDFLPQDSAFQRWLLRCARHRCGSATCLAGLVKYSPRHLWLSSQR